MDKIILDESKMSSKIISKSFVITIILAVILDIVSLFVNIETASGLWVYSIVKSIIYILIILLATNISINSCFKKFTINKNDVHGVSRKIMYFYIVIVVYNLFSSYSNVSTLKEEQEENIKIVNEYIASYEYYLDDDIIEEVNNAIEESEKIISAGFQIIFVTSLIEISAIIFIISKQNSKISLLAKDNFIDNTIV